MREFYIEKVDLVELETHKLEISGNNSKSSNYGSYKYKVSEILKKIVEKNLGKQVQNNTDLFDLGMESIEIMKVINEIDVLLGVRITFSEIFDASTVEELTNLLLKKNESNTTISLAHYLFSKYSQQKEKLYGSLK
ncbi:acyl carrier protein [Enterococcus hulanensis]|uniref:acyl carrier protein n=1 Tax=Enterococcus hulanensis TaxID=2559929 RepID=UPI00288C6DB5|nr:acyl carrier protein [Enterococcus hulanensis]MDT2660512.1 acyl carrier protein [Enterococcus hulanensis]